MLPRHLIRKRHMELMRIICQDNHGRAEPSGEHRDLERWGYIHIVTMPNGEWAYSATAEGRAAERTWREMREPE